MTPLNIVVNDTFMDNLTADYNKCAGKVGDVLKEIAKMEKIMGESYKGYASMGLNDFYSVLQQHLVLLQRCYKHLAHYTVVAKEITFERDYLLSRSLIKYP